MKINKIFCHKKQAGLSMVEIGLVFTVIAVAVAGVMYAYNSVVKAQKYDETVKQIVNLGAGELAYMAENSRKSNQLNVLDLLSEAYMPNILSDATKGHWINPFGGSVALYRSGQGNLFSDDDGIYHGQFRLSIIMPDKQTCVRFAGMLKNNLKVGRVVNSLATEVTGGCNHDGDGYYVCVAFNNNGLGKINYCGA